MGRPSYKKELKNALLEAGIYEPRLDAQIALTADMMTLHRRLVERLKHDGNITYTVFEKNNEIVVVNPLVSQITNLAKQIQDAYTALGLNYKSKSSNIKESVRKDAEDKPTGLSVLLGELSNVVD